MVSSRFGFYLFCGYISLVENSKMLCPDNTWGDSGGKFCYRLTSQSHLNKSGIAMMCASAKAQLATVVTVSARNAVWKFLGKRTYLYEIWVHDCDPNANICEIMSNWIDGTAVSETYACFGKPCLSSGRQGLCQIDKDLVNQCGSAPCQHGGMCTDGYKSFSCRCPAGTSGQRCETDIDECVSHPCQHGGTCTDYLNRFTCTCAPGYTGVLCKTDIDECSSNPCQNSANCTDVVNGYKCTCEPGFTGNDCQTDIDECKSEPCQNNGNCTDMVKGYNCSCTSGYTGIICETDIDECSSNPCQNSVNCTDLVNGYKCTCKPGFTGNDCQTEINECLSQPCENSGTCVDLVNRFNCSCAAGYTGSTCGIDIDDCMDDPCQGNGDCADLINGFLCTCKQGFSGSSCEKVLSQSQTSVITSSVVIPLIIIITVIIIVVVVLRRRSHKDTHSKPVEMHPVPIVDIIQADIAHEQPRPARDDNEPQLDPEIAAEDASPDPDEKLEVIYVNTMIDDSQNTRVTARDFQRRVESMSKRKLFEKEYKILPSGVTATCVVANLPQNQHKNRFLNIRTYDHSRVVLEELDGEKHSDYINASYIHGYKKENKYIATQGPKQSTITDLWRMIWQVNCRTVVMVTRLFEETKTKCIKYWPDVKPAEHAGIRVTRISEEELSDYVIRIFQLEKDGDKRLVNHFQFTSWLDQSVPKHITSLLNFRRKVNSFQSAEKGPIVVHCSAGIGRTGSYIAIDYLLEQAEAEGELDVFTCVQDMRKQRIKMVQTLGQYIFVHVSVADALVSGVTSFPAATFFSTYKELTEKGGVLLKQQYQLVQSLRKSSPEENYAWALQPEYVEKNRDLSILPDKTACPFLSTPVTNCNEYINAAFISSFTKQNAFLLTQTPLPGTVADIWRMLYECQSNYIVMFDDIDATENCQYWPEDNQVLSFGSLKIEMLSSHENAAAIIMRTFKLTHGMQPTDVRSVTQFQMKQWNVNDNVPADTQSFRSLIELVTASTVESGKGPITLHDRNGCNRCGIFCAVSCIWEKLKVDQEVDIFTIVRQIRLNRPQLIVSYEQYAFCYEMVKEFIQSYDTYSNFA